MSSICECFFSCFNLCCVEVDETNHVNGCCCEECCVTSCASTDQITELANNILSTSNQTARFSNFENSLIKEQKKRNPTGQVIYVNKPGDSAFRTPQEAASESLINSNGSLMRSTGSLMQSTGSVDYTSSNKAPPPRSVSTYR